MDWKEVYRQNEYKIENPGINFTRLVEQDLGLMTEVVEIGCGKGRQILYIARRRPDITFLASDISKEAITNLKRVVEAWTADMRDTRLPSEEMSHVISWRVLHHLPENERKEAVKELRRVVKPNGVIYIAGRAPFDQGYGWGTETEENSFVVLDKSELPPGGTFYPKDKYHPWHFFKEKEMVGLIEESGLEIDQMGLIWELSGLHKYYKAPNSYWMMRVIKPTGRWMVWQGVSLNG